MDRIDPNKPNAKGKTIMDYIPMAAQRLGVSLDGNQPAPGEAAVAASVVSAEPVIGKKELTEAMATLKKYKDGKSNLEARIVEEERWWKLRHWDVIRGKSKEEQDRPEPTTVRAGNLSLICFSMTSKRASPSAGVSGGT